MENSLFHSMFDWLKSAYLGLSVNMLKLPAGTYYLEGVKGAHRILYLICLMVLLITLIGDGAFGAPLFMPWEFTTKATVGIIGGAVYLLVPAVALISLLSDKRWLQLTGATGVLRGLME